MKNYIYQRAVTEIRIPINEDGKLGTPEIVKKYIQDIKGKSTKYVRTAGEANKAKKKDTKKNMDDLFKMQVGKEEELQ